MNFKSILFATFLTGAIGGAYLDHMTPKPVPMDEKDTKIKRYEKILAQALGEVPTMTFSTPVTVTAYSARAEETNSEPWYTADMSLSRVGVLAVSRDILDEIGIEYGDTVILGDYGMFKVHDTMNKRFYRRVDILMGNKKAAQLFGIKKNVKLTWFGKGGYI